MRPPKIYTSENISQTLQQWADQLNVSYFCLYHRIHMKHWDLDKALSTRSRDERWAFSVDYNGKPMSFYELHKYTTNGISKTCLTDRLRKGWSVEDALHLKKREPLKAEDMTVAQLAIKYKMSEYTIRTKIKAGKLGSPPNQCIYKDKTCAQWARDLQLPYYKVYKAILCGKDPREI